MNKNRIRLTESQLHRVIKESVKNVLNEIKLVGTIDDFWKEQKEKEEYRKKQREERPPRMKTPSYMHLFNQYGGVKGAAYLYLISNGKNTELGQALIEYGNVLKLDDLDPKHIARYLIANYPKLLTFQK